MFTGDGEFQPGSRSSSAQSSWPSTHCPFSSRASGAVAEPRGDRADDVGWRAGVGVETERAHVLDHPLGGDEARVQVVGEDPVLLVLELHDADQPVDRTLRHAVAEAPAALTGGRGRVGHPRTRRHGHEAAVAALDHLRQHQLGEDDRGHRVGLEVLVEQLDRRLEQPVHVAGPDVAGVVDEHVDAAPALEHGGDRRAQRRAVGDVEEHRQRLAAFGLDQGSGGVERTGQGSGVGPLDGRRVLAGFALVHGAGRQRDVVARACEVHRDGFADAAAGAGDERDSPGIRHLSKPPER